MSTCYMKHNQVLADTLNQFHILPDEAGVRLPTARVLLGCSSATIWRLVKAGKIKTCKISVRVTLFNIGSIRALLRVG